MYPTPAATPAQRSAYGACVLTWSTWSAADAIEDITVVSEMGEQWSPKTAPARTDPSVANRMDSAAPPMLESSPVSAHAIGPAIGKTIAMVPNDVPVANAMRQDTTKTISGRKRTSVGPGSISEMTQGPVSRCSLHTPPSVHASDRMRQAMTIALHPVTHASSVSFRVSVCVAAAIRMATRLPPNEAQSRTDSESALPMMFRRPVHSPPVSFRPEKMRPTMTITPIEAMGRTALRRFSFFSSGIFISVSSRSMSGEAPSRRSIPVSTARRSARSMGPKSRPVQAMTKTKKIIRRL